MRAHRFHTHETRAWVRTLTHTVVRDDEPDFDRFVASGAGYVQRVVRVWLTEPGGEPHALREYLGSVKLSRACPALRELRRIFRRAEMAVSGRADVDVRAELSGLLRRTMSEAGPSARTR